MMYQFDFTGLSKSFLDCHVFVDFCACRQPNSDECVFEFRWKSTVACHVERYSTVKAFRDLFKESLIEYYKGIILVGA